MQLIDQQFHIVVKKEKPIKYVRPSAGFSRGGAVEVANGGTGKPKAGIENMEGYNRQPSLHQTAYKDITINSVIGSLVSQNIYATCGFPESPKAPTPKLRWHHGLKKSVTVSFCDSCYGLICLILKPEAVVLWNPCTNQQFELPCSPIKNEDSEREFGYGFGYDDVHDDYKVVRLAQLYDEPCRQDVEVYSLKSNSWRSIPEFPYVLSKRFTNAVFTRGSIHWCMGLEQDDNPNLIVALDLTTEKHHLVSLPDGIGSMKMQRFEVLDDSLFLMVCEDKTRWADMWVMKECGVRESWTKILVVPPLFMCFKPMAYSLGKKQKYIVFQNNNYLRRFDTENKMFDGKVSILDDSWMSLMSGMEAYAFIPTFVRLPNKPTALARLNQRIHSLFAGFIARINR